MLKQIASYGVVGLSGFFVNLGAFSFAKFLLDFGPNSSSIFAFLLSVTGNYALNRKWTFNSGGQKRIRFMEGLVKYISANLFGLSLTLITLNTVIYSFGESFAVFGQIFGVCIGMISNFIFSKILIFKC